MLKSLFWLGLTIPPQIPKSMKLIANYYLALFVCLSYSITFSNTGSSSTYSSNMTMQRVRIDFQSPNGYVRPLLLGFTADNAATDGVDYGYDGANFDQFPDDLFWLIENESYVIQGVGAFDITKQYPLALFLENAGTINISLNSLENFDNDINVYVFDSLLDSYTLISETEFTIDMDNGEFLNRFFIAFMNPSDSENDNNDDTALSVEEFNSKNNTIQYVSNSKEIKISLSNTTHKIKGMTLYSMNGQQLNHYRSTTNSSTQYFPINHSMNQYIVVEVKTEYQTIRKMLALY